MGLGNILVLAQVTAFLLSFILSFFMFVPMSVNQHEFDGNCLLYTKGKWTKANETALPELGNIDWGAKSACGFTIFLGVILMLVSLFYVVWLSVYLVRNTDSSWLDAFVTALLSILLFLMVFSAALNHTIGFNKWCDLLTSPESLIDSCEVAGSLDFVKALQVTEPKYFYSEMKMVEFGCWTMLICWSVLLVIGMVKVYRYQKHETFLSSMNRERQRLLQKVGHKPTAI